MVCAAPRKWPPWPTSSWAPKAIESSSISSGVNSCWSICTQLDVDDELLEAGDQAALEPAGGVHHPVGAGQERRQHRHQRLVAGLRVGHLRGREPAAGAERQPEVAGDLAGAEQADAGLRRAERRRARTACRCWRGTSRRPPGRPGRISCESAMPDSASAICCTSAAGIVTGDIAPIRMNGVSTTGWLAAEYSNCASSIRSSQRSGELQLISEMHRRRLLDRLARAEQDLGHRDGVRGVDPGDDVAHVDLVGQRLQRVDHVEVPAVERGVVGLVDHAAGRVERRRSSGRAG